MSLEPICYTGMLVSTVIVYDQMQVKPYRSLAVYFLEEADKLLMPMARHTIADNFTVDHVEGCK